MTKARETADIVESKNQCTAWCVFDGTLTGTNPPISGFNVASVTRTALGRHTINFANPMDNADFAATSLAVTIAATTLMIESGAIPRTINNVSLVTLNESASALDSPLVSVLVFGGKN